MHGSVCRANFAYGTVCTAGKKLGEWWNIEGGQGIFALWKVGRIFAW